MTDLPDGIARPARRALEQAGIERMEDITKVTEPELRSLHGMGQSALAKIRDALEEQGLAFRKP
jgi:DNA-directed RNA polymerase alpha subunit